MKDKTLAHYSLHPTTISWTNRMSGPDFRTNIVNGKLVYSGHVLTAWYNANGWGAGARWFNPGAIGMTGKKHNTSGRGDGWMYDNGSREHD